MGPGRDGAEAFKAEQFKLVLEALRWNWGEAYDIWMTPDGWFAMRKDGKGEALRANTPDALREAIFKDYAVLPVPRDADGET